MRQATPAIITGTTGKPFFRNKDPSIPKLKTRFRFYINKTLLLFTLAVMCAFILAESSAKPEISGGFWKDQINEFLPTSVTILDSPAVIFLPIIVNATKNINIYYVSPSGLDSNPGTFTQPWRTISKAARTVKAGDVVYIRGGTYVEAVEIFNLRDSRCSHSIFRLPRRNGDP